MALDFTEVAVDDIILRLRREDRRREQIVAALLAVMAGVVALSIIAN